MMSNYLTALDEDKQKKDVPESFTRQFVKVQDMRYGENPHQKAAFYREVHVGKGLLASYKQLHGKALSYNNIADSDAAWEAVRQFAEPACVIIKHANPCGVAVGADSAEAYAKAFKTDSKSAFGGILAFNTPVTAACAEMISKQFAEVIMAPAFDADALAILEKKPNLRRLTIDWGDLRDGCGMNPVDGALQSPRPESVRV